VRENEGLEREDAIEEADSLESENGARRPYHRKGP